jgi:hypothetical protein
VKGWFRVDDVVETGAARSEIGDYAAVVTGNV